MGSNLTWNNFKSERLDVLQDIERDHFWFQGRLKLVLSALKAHVKKPSPVLADIGCGTGFNLSKWKPYGQTIVGFDRHADRLSNLLAETPAPHLIKGDVESFPVRENSVDVLLALDVIEHVQDETAMDQFYQTLRPQGLLVVTVPAISWLWSYRDQDAGHLRRYSKSGLTQLVLHSGFKLESVKFYQFLLFPLVMLSRLNKQKQTFRNFEDKPPAFLNTVMKIVTRFEVALTNLGVSFPIGSSLIIIARKP